MRKSESWATVAKAIALLVLGGLLGPLIERGVGRVSERVHPRGYDYTQWSPESPQWGAQVAQQIRRSSQFDKVSLFVGDSLTYGMAVSNLPFKAENFGVNGDTVVGVATRVKRYSYTGVARVFLQIGINDWPRDGWRSYEVVFRQILAAIPPTTPVVVQSLTPSGVDAPRWFDGNHHIAALSVQNQRLLALCASRDNCQFIDLATLLSGPDGHLLAEYDAGDGIHLSSRGYEVWRKLISQM